MKSMVKKLKDCKVKLTIEVESQLVENRFQEIFRDFQKAASLPGFRAGKAPADLIEKKFTKEAQEEVLKSLIPETYHQSVATQKLSPVSLPSISDIRMERGKGLSFSAEFENAPEFSLKNYKGLRIKKSSMEVSLEDAEKGLWSLRDSRAELVEISGSRQIAAGDFVVADIDLWKDGAYTQSRKGVLLFVEPHGSDDFFEKIVGAHIDEVMEISVNPTEDEKKQIIVGKKPAYKIWVRTIKEKKLPILDDEFAKSFGKESMDELKEAVRKDIAQYKKAESFEKMKHDLFDQLLSLTDVTLPEGLLEKQKEKLMDQVRRQAGREGLANGKMDGEIKKVEEEAAAKAKEQVKLYFILQKVAELESIEIDEIELEKRLQGLADESKRPLDEARRVFEDDLRERLRETQTIDFLLANAKLEEERSEAKDQ